MRSLSAGAPGLAAHGEQERDNDVEPLEMRGSGPGHRQQARLDPHVRATHNDQSASDGGCGHRPREKPVLYKAEKSGKFPKSIKCAAPSSPQKESNSLASVVSRNAQLRIP